MAGAAARPLGAGAAAAGGAGPGGPDGGAGYRAGPHRGTGRAAPEAARGPRPARLHRGPSPAPRPHEQGQNLQRRHGALGAGSGSHSHPGGGRPPCARAGAGGRGGVGRGVSAPSRCAAARPRLGGQGQPTGGAMGRARRGYDGPSLAMRWPCGGPLCTKHAFPGDCVHGTVTGPGGQSVPMPPGRTAQCPAKACDACPQRTPWPPAQRGPGRTLPSREDEPCQQKRRAKLKTPRGRAARRQRTAGEHTIAQQLAHPGRRARYTGWRTNQCDGRRHAAVSNLQVAAHYQAARLLAS